MTLFGGNDAKNSVSLYTGSEANLRETVLGEGENNNHIGLPGKWGYSGQFSSVQLLSHD